MGEKRQEVGQRIAGLPEVEAGLRRGIYGKEQILPALTQQRDAAIMELYQTDKDLANRYAKPESEMFIEDPYARESLVAGRHQDIYNSLAQTVRLQEARKNVLDDALERGIKIYQAGIDALKTDLGYLGEEFRNTLSLAEFEERKATKKATAGKEAQTTKTQQDLLNILLGQQITPTESKPTTSPGAVSAVSPRGQWTWDYDAGDWIPVGKSEALKKSKVADILRSDPEAAGTITKYLEDIFPKPGEGKTLDERKAVEVPQVISEFKSGSTVEQVKERHPLFDFEELDSYAERYSPKPVQEPNFFQKFFERGGNAQEELTATTTVDPTIAAWVKATRDAGDSDEEIRAELERQGYNPNLYL